MTSMINKKAVDVLCEIVGLNPDGMRHMTIDVERPGVVTVKADFYLLPVPEPAEPARKAKK